MFAEKMKTIPEDTTQVVRNSVEQACKDFTARVLAMGFSRTKKMFWTRPHEHTVDFIHFHRHGSTYGRPINYSVNLRVHFGIRVLNDTFIAASLNGPCSEPELIRTGRYHLRFNAQSGSTYDRCIDDLERLVLDQSEPWFSRFLDPQKLLLEADSPLKQEEKDRLRASLQGVADPIMVAQSMKILGIKRK